MLLNNKIKSFTVTEMLVVMVLITIVISIAIIVLNLVQNELKGIQQNLKNSSELRTFEHILWNDFNKNTVFLGNNQLICTSPLDTVVYQFKKKYVLRNNDTLNVVVKQKIFFIDSKKTFSNVDAVELSFSKEFQNKQLFVYKPKDASFYMNNGL